MAEAESGQSIAGAAGETPAPGVASLWSRRDFFGRLGWTGFSLIAIAGLLSAVRSAFPRVLFKPDTTFKAGPLEDFVVGEVNEKFKSEYRVWIIREPEGFFALYAKCTHLGCTVTYLASENKFKCPCHGSGFQALGGAGIGHGGVNFEGPAPRPLERVRVARTEDGQLLVDVGVKYRQENGDWDKAGAFLRV